MTVSVRGPPRTKRKAINEYFAPQAKRPAIAEKLKATPEHCSNRSQGTFTAIAEVPGLELHEDFVTNSEEQSILAFLNDASKCSWRTDLSRRTMHFGGTYCLFDKTAGAKANKPEVLTAPPMPVELGWLIDRMVNAGIFEHDRRPRYCIVNEYIGSNGISAHTENYRFSEPVVGLSLLAAGPIRFREMSRAVNASVRSGKAAKVEKTGKVADVQLPGRSLLVMRGASRWRWQHEIVRTSKGRDTSWKRVSLTFRHAPD